MRLAHDPSRSHRPRRRRRVAARRVVAPRAAARRGFTLLELLFTVALLGLFMILFSQLFISTHSIARAVPREDADAARIDMVLGVLRRDVWHARQVEVVGPRHVVIRTGEDHVVTWKFDDTGRLSRVSFRSQPANAPANVVAAPDRVDHWDDMAPIRGFDEWHQALRITLHERVLRRDSTILLTGQVLAARGDAP